MEKPVVEESDSRNDSRNDFGNDSRNDSRNDIMNDYEEVTAVRDAENGAGSPAPRLVLCKLILGIISMVLCVIILFQSCAAGLSNAIEGNGEISGSFGVLIALNLLFSGIIAVAARKSVSRIPMIIAVALLWFNYFIAKMYDDSYGFLEIWGFLCFVFGVVYLFSIPRTRKQYLIAAGLSAVYLAAALL